MKSIIKLVAIIIAVQIFLTGCNDFFLVSYDVDIPDHEKKLVSYCYINPDAQNIRVLVYHSQEIYDDQDPSVTDASIELKADGEIIADNFLLEKIFSGINYENGDSIFHYFYNKDIVLPTDRDITYELLVEAPGFETIHSEAIVPERITLDEINLNEKAISDTDGYRMDELEINFRDEGGVENYYMVTALLDNNSGPVEPWNYIYLETIDPRIEKSSYTMLGLENINSFVYFEDKDGFDGIRNTISLSCDISDYVQSGDELKVRLYSISKDFYNFIHAYNQYSKAEDFAFISEPVVIPSNFENGYGLFTVYEYDEKKLEF